MLSLYSNEEYSHKPSIKVRPICQRSETIYQLAEHAFIGVSPFNSYFTQERLVKLFDWGISKFKHVTICMPDGISIYNLMAMGHSSDKAQKKTKRQDNYLKNKIFRALKILEKDKNINDRYCFIPLSEILKIGQYKTIYNNCLNEFHSNPSFRKGAMSITSTWSKYHSENKDIALSEEAMQIAVNYILIEFPIFLNIPEILSTSSSSYVYHSMPTYLENLYQSGHMVSSRQGCLEVQIP